MGNKTEGRYSHVVHSFAPVYREDSEILILGSLPSVKSREQGFYYGHPQNRFWRLLAELLGCGIPKTIAEKKDMMLSHGIAVYDVVLECDIIGSSDSSIKNVVPVNLKKMLDGSRITRIYANGRLAGKLYSCYLEPQTGIPATVLPSTSPANAAYNMERLKDAWRVIVSGVAE
ncbi:MAG: DNA-deoxyinosine glycosylase [Lachnospiraceae bacterium]|nr:DNA-deoxyinosine glycosylase [Lachnospiraceae bacterium]